MDNIFVINQIIEKAIEYNFEVKFLFINFNKAFNLVMHNFMWKALTSCLFKVARGLAFASSLRRTIFEWFFDKQKLFVFTHLLSFTHSSLNHLITLITHSLDQSISRLYLTVIHTDTHTPPEILNKVRNSPTCNYY